MADIVSQQEGNGVMSRINDAPNCIGCRNWGEHTNLTHCPKCGKKLKY